MSDLKSKLAETIRRYNQKNWSPATSTNYSFSENKSFYVSKSGIDKAEFSDADFVEIDLNGELIDKTLAAKASAETLIHCTIYKLFPKTKVILHAHSIYSVLNSQKYKEEINFEDYEIQKGFSGQTTHEKKISIPIFANSQNMNEFSQWMKNRKNELNMHCFIIKNHGTYAWGENLFEAKRHLETLEYLLEINWILNS